MSVVTVGTEAAASIWFSLQSIEIQCRISLAVRDNEIGATTIQKSILTLHFLNIFAQPSVVEGDNYGYLNSRQSLCMQYIV